MKGSFPLVNSKAAQKIWLLDSYTHGVSLGAISLSGEGDKAGSTVLRLEPLSDQPSLKSRYALRRGKPLEGLEEKLQAISRQSQLSDSAVIFGLDHDPFFPFDQAFYASLQALELLDRYRPGRIVLQTRSPLAVIALPALRKFGDSLEVTVGIESPLQECVDMYTPGLPTVQERIKFIRTLRNFGIKVRVQASPVLPYGDWRKDAAKFAEMLIENSDSIRVGPLCPPNSLEARRAGKSELAHALARNRAFHYLRPDAAQPLISAIEMICPEKLCQDVWPTVPERQLGLFKRA